MSRGPKPDKELYRAVLDRLALDKTTSDSSIARATGASRTYVARVRKAEGLASAVRAVQAGDRTYTLGQGEKASQAARGRAGDPRNETSAHGPWPARMDRVFREGRAELLEAVSDFRDDLVRFRGLLDKYERSPAMRRATRSAQAVTLRVEQAMATILNEMLPVGPCPFCKASGNPGCDRCSGSGWAPADTVDVLSSLQEKQSKARWWAKTAPTGGG